MTTPPEPSSRLTRRTRILLAAGGGVLAVLLAVGALLALNPPLQARLTHTLPGLVVDPCVPQPGKACP